MGRLAMVVLYLIPYRLQRVDANVIVERVTGREKSGASERLLAYDRLTACNISGKICAPRGAVTAAQGAGVSIKGGSIMDGRPAGSASRWRQRAARVRDGRVFLAIFAAGVLVFALATNAFASIPDHNQVYHGCVQSGTLPIPGTGTLRLIDTDRGQTCNRTETAVSWNANGVAGPSGSTGPQGPTGATGPSGTIGLAGESGPMGPTGTEGATGATGPSGPTGVDGASGVPGPSGAVGPTGADGTTGPSGLSGATGPSGPTGADGTTGPSGPSGATGPSGPTGADG